MPKAVSDLLKEIASQASAHQEPILAHLCRMAALKAAHLDLPLNWSWDVGTTSSSSDAISDNPTDRAPNPPSKPYQVWSRKGTGSYSVIVSSAKAALAAVAKLSSDGHSGLVIRDLDGNAVDLEVLKVIVDLDANPTIRLVHR